MITVAMIWDTRYGQILSTSTSGALLDKTSDEITSADLQMRFYCIALWIAGFIEFCIIFAGNTLFNQQTNLLMIFSHLSCIALLLTFKNA